MSLVILLLALIWIAVDFTALIFFYFHTGFWTTLGLLAATALAGVLLFKWQMGGVWRQFKEKLSQASLPGVETADAMLLFFACCLMIAPFPLMDLVGLSLMLPPLRRLVARRIKNWVAKRFEPGRSGFVFQVGGVAAHGWPPPAYTEIDPAGRRQDADPGLPDGGSPRAAETAPHSLADEVGEEVEEAEFRSVSSNEGGR